MAQFAIFAVLVLPFLLSAYLYGLIEFITFLFPGLSGLESLIVVGVATVSCVYIGATLLSGMEDE